MKRLGLALLLAALLATPLYAQELVEGQVRRIELVKAGDKIRFDAQKVGGAFRVTRIERVN